MHKRHSTFISLLKAHLTITFPHINARMHTHTCTHSPTFILPCLEIQMHLLLAKQFYLGLHLRWRLFKIVSFDNRYYYWAYLVRGNISATTAPSSERPFAGRISPGSLNHMKKTHLLLPILRSRRSQYVLYIDNMSITVHKLMIYFH